MMAWGSGVVLVTITMQLSNFVGEGRVHTAVKSHINYIDNIMGDKSLLNFGMKFQWLPIITCEILT